MGDLLAAAAAAALAFATVGGAGRLLATPPAGRPPAGRPPEPPRRIRTGAGSIPAPAAAALGAAAGALAGVALLGLPFAAPAAAAASLAALRVRARAGARLTTELENRLPAGLAVQASALRAGRTTVEALRAVAGKTGPPLSTEVSLTLRAVDLGEPLDAALRQLAQGTGSRDVALWVAVMLAHREAGGNIAAGLDSLAERLRERARLRAETRALTAQARLSGIVVGLAPLAFLLLLTSLSGPEVRSLYATGPGLASLLAGTVLDLLGFIWISRIVRFRA